MATKQRRTFELTLLHHRVQPLRAARVITAVMDAGALLRQWSVANSIAAVMNIFDKTLQGKNRVGRICDMILRQWSVAHSWKQKTIFCCMPEPPHVLVSGTEK